jgi:hypothetical protein
MSKENRAVPMCFDIRSTEQLDNLPSCAVVYDTSCQVWQKLGLETRSDAWYQPGLSSAFEPSDIELPACLLDDGL